MLPGAAAIVPRSEARTRRPMQGADRAALAVRAARRAAAASCQPAMEPRDRDREQRGTEHRRGRSTRRGLGARMVEDDTRGRAQALRDARCRRAPAARRDLRSAYQSCM
jgi:hypothetical protein